MKSFPSLYLVIFPQVAILFGMAHYSDVTGASGFAVAAPLLALEVVYLIALFGIIALFFANKDATASGRS